MSDPRDYKLDLVKFEGRLIMLNKMKPTEKLLAADPLNRQVIDGLATLRVNGAFDLAAEGKKAEAIEYVNQNAATYNIAAVNMSLGGNAQAGYCDTDPRKVAILPMAFCCPGKAQPAPSRA